MINQLDVERPHDIAIISCIFHELCRISNQNSVLMRPTDLDIIIGFKKILSVVRQGKFGGFPGSFSFLVVSSPSHLHNDITVSLISEQISPQLTKQKTKNIKCLN